MKLLKFNSYEDYKRIQIETNKRKLQKISTTAKELRFVANFIQKNIPEASFGLCHGVRNGYEVKQLRALLGVNVLGTEISETANQFEHVMQWDFHDVKQEWTGNVDFIYSNAWDHSYDPDAMLRSWMSCLRPNGRCFLQWTRRHTDRALRGADCFGLSFDEMIQWASKDYKVEKVKKIQEFKSFNALTLLQDIFKKGRLSIRGGKVFIVILKNKN